MDSISTNNLVIEGELKVEGIQSYICRCICGKKIIVYKYLFNRGSITSCGCKNTTNKPKGIGKTKIYKLWVSIKKRCRDSNHYKYKDYGAKGINMDDDWYNNFENFYKEVGEVPEGLTLGIMDESKGYSPGNCKWVYKP